MKISNKLKAFMEKAEKSDSYWITKAKLAFAVALEEKRKKARMSYKDMAIKLETSPAYMTKVFRGDANLTIESMVKLARAAGGQLSLDITEPVVESAPWSIDVIRATPHKGHISGISGTVIEVDFAAVNHDQLVHRVA